MPRKINQFIIILLLTGYLVVPEKVAAIPVDNNCTLVAQNDAWRCQNRNWIYKYFRYLVQSDKSKYIRFHLDQAGCRFGLNATYQPPDNLITQCQNQLGRNFECAVTITIVKDGHVKDQTFYDRCPQIKQH